MQNRSCEKRACALARVTVMVLAALLSAHGRAQMSTTTVQGTVYRADGTPAGGTLLIHWPAFTTAQNQAVAAGSLNAAIGADGFVSVNLTPNAGALPAGSYYTATYHLNDGTVNEEYWVVPASGTATVGAVRAQLQPAMTAVEPAVTPDYVQGALAGLSGSYLPLTGGTMSGTLTLNGDPAASAQATTKHYVDQLAAQNLPLSGGTLTGPLTAPSISAKQLEGRFYADQNGTSSNGIAMSVSQCLSLPYACRVVAPSLYAMTERPTLSSFTPAMMAYEDDRNGTQTEYFHNPSGPLLNYPYGVPQVGRAKAIYAGFDGYNSRSGNGVENIAYYDATPGFNLSYPGYTGSQGWAGGNVIDAQQQTWGMGIQEMITSAMNAYGEGDHLLQYNYNFSRDMWVTAQDEGANAFSAHMDEPSNEFTGPCTSGCTTGTTRLKVASPTQGAGTQGVGQYAILDGTQNACSVTAIGAGISPAMAGYTVSGCTITPSTGWGTLNSPGINFTINLNPPFTVSTTFVVTLVGGTAPTTATQMCAVDKRDCFYPTSVSVAGSQITVTAPLRMEHLSGIYFFWGGVTGDVLDFPAFDAAGNKYVSQVAGAINATTLEVFMMRQGYAATPDLPQSWQPGTSNSVSSSGTTVSFTPTAGLPNYGWPGVNILISGCSDSALNTACTNVSWPNSSVGNCTIAGLSGTHSCSGSITTSMTGTGGIATNTVYLYNAAQVTDVQNTTTGTTVQGSTNVAVASTATISAGELVGGPGIASGTTVASASGTTLVLSTPAVASGTGTLLFQKTGQNSMLPDGTISLEQNSLAVTTSSTVELASPVSAHYQAAAIEATTNNPYEQVSGGFSVSWQGPGATNTDNGNSMYYAGNGNPDSMYQGLGGIYTAPLVFLEQGPYSAGMKYLEGPTLNGNFIYIFPNAAQTANPLYSFNLWDVQNANGQTFSANYSPYNNTFTFGCTASGCQYRFPTPATTANDTEPATTAFVKSVACQANGTNCPAPSGTAGGDLSGSYPNPTVAKINGATVTRGTATLVSGTVTVSNAAACAVGATCVYKFTHCGTNSSTAIGTLSLGTVTAGTSFVINSLSATNAVATGDASTVCWQIN